MLCLFFCCCCGSDDAVRQMNQPSAFVIGTDLAITVLVFER